MNLEEQLSGIISTAEAKGNMLKEAEPEKKEEVPAEVKQNSEESGVEEAADDSKTKEETTESEQEGGEEEAPSDELDDEFKNLDPEVRDALKKADAETRQAQANAFKKMRASFDKKSTELGQKRKLAETAEQIFQRYGMDPSVGLSQVEKLIRFEKELEKDPRHVINLLKQKFDIKEEKKSGSDELDESLLTDEEKVLYSKLKNSEKQIEELRRKQEDDAQRIQREEIERARREIEAFKSQTNEDGSLKNPYFDELIEDIGRLTDLYPKDNIAKLYERAVRLNDDVYTKSLEDAKKREREKVLREKQEQVNKAKAINSQTAKSSPKTVAKPALDDILLSILEQSSA